MTVGIIWSVCYDSGHYMECVLRQWALYGVWHYRVVIIGTISICKCIRCSGHYIEYDVLPCSERWAL